MDRLHLPSRVLYRSHDTGQTVVVSDAFLQGFGRGDVVEL